MNQQPYHHGQLKETLIHEGLTLLNKEGYDHFSMRKLAKDCGVSHAAPYKHFANKDQLIEAIIAEAMNEFAEAVAIAPRQYPDDPGKQILEMGKGYVKFMVEHPDYLRFLFVDENITSIVVEDEDIHPSEHLAFNIFKKSANNYLDSVQASVELRNIDLMHMWSTVHGLSLLIASNMLNLGDGYMDYVHMVLERLILDQAGR